MGSYLTFIFMRKAAPVAQNISVFLKTNEKMRGLCKFAFLFALTSASWVSDFKNRAVLSLREEGTLDEKAEQIRKDVFQILSLQEVLIPFFCISRRLVQDIYHPRL